MNHTSVKGYRSRASEYVQFREDFTTGGALRGQSGSGSYLGQLPTEWEELFRSRQDHITYVVWSYSTPIAWYDHENGWVFPAVRYSATTSQHQGVVRRAGVTESVLVR